ncbi:MAG TPA: hypothetical protein VLU25_19510 [Acidobacteriota bacterium]|nr:hypothetical protein [Acidobacteriota bacterium]
MSRNFRPRLIRTLSRKLAAALVAAVLPLGTALALGSPGAGELRLGKLQPSNQGTLEATVELTRLPSGLSGIQFDLVMADPDLQVEAVLSPVMRKSGKLLYLRPIGPGVYRLLIAGFNQGPIEAGAVATLTVSGSAPAAPGTQVLSVRRVIGTDGDGRRLNFASTVEEGRPAAGDRERRSRMPYR